MTSDGLISCPLVLLVILAVASPVIQQPPKFKKQPKAEQLYQVSESLDEAEKPFQLDCEAEGYPEPKYKWIKNGLEFDYVAYDKRISQQRRKGTLVFTKPEPVDEGLYQCFADNVHGTAMSNAVFLRKAELNSFPDEEPLVVDQQEGKPLTVECNPPTGYPKPAIFWSILSNSGALRTINSSRLTVDPEGRLHFSNVTIADMLTDGTYACSATSHFRTEYKIGKKILLKVTSSGASGHLFHPPVKQYVSPPNIPALRGHNLQLHCIYGGTPLPHITWRKRGGSIEGNRYNLINFGKTLEIRAVDFEDEGTFECTASNGIGNQQSNAMSVTVQAAPYWKRAPNNTNVAEGEEVRFECLAGGFPEPKLQWFMNGVPIDRAPPSNKRRLEGTVLVVENLGKADTAVYQCNASNVHGYAFSNFYVNVLALPPSIVEKPQPVTKTVVTATVLLRCKVFGAPNPLVKWLKDGIELTGGRYQVLPEGHLQITDVKIIDRGQYVCFAVNKFGQATASGELDIRKKTKITHPPANIELAAGKPAYFKCHADTDPNLGFEITWSFNGVEIDFDHNQRFVKGADNALTIAKTRELDSGVYTCTARTELDQDTANASLTVQDVPNRPKIVKIDCEPSAALIEWNPTGDGRAQILSYSIQFNTSFTPNIWDDAFINIPAPDNKFKVFMSPWTNYTFRVIAHNKVGPSLPSAPSERCTTGEEPPHKNPEGVTGRGDSPTDLVISWTVMPQIEHNAPGFFYKVYWKRDDIEHSMFQSQRIEDWTQNRLVIENQPTYKPYRIKVEAHNRRGQAITQATEVLGHSGEARPAEAPKNFRHVSTNDSTSAVVAWDPVSPESVNGFFRGYKIQTWTTDETEDKLREFIVPSNVSSAYVTIFKPFSKNIVQVLAFNDMFNGPPSDRVEFLTPEGVPGPVSALTAIQMGSSALYLMWKKPEEPNGILTEYRIYYEEVDGTALGPMIERQPAIKVTETRTKIAGLKSGTKYRITIYPTTRKGQGEGYFIETSTRSDDGSAPDPPSFIYRKLPHSDGKSGIIVTWRPNLDGKPGSHFYVQYRRKGEQQFQSSPKEVKLDSITISGLDVGVTYEVRAVSVDGTQQTPSNIVDIYIGDETMLAATASTEHLAKADWLIGMICAIALVIILAIIVCLIKRNRGGKYLVYEKEASRGGNGTYGDDGGFNEYTKPIDSNVPIGSRTSLTSSLRNPDPDTDSMTDYGEDDSSKFGEDGSFIGQYGTKKKAAEGPLPTGVATFV